MFIANDISLGNDTNNFTYRMHNGNDVVEYMVFSKAILDHTRKQLDIRTISLLFH